MKVKNLLCLALAISMIVLVAPASAQGTLFVNPSSVVDPAITTFTITVEVDSGVTNLWGYEFVLRYDTAVLTATLSTPSTDFPDVSKNEIDDAAGLVWVAASLPLQYPPLPGLDGPRTLATIEFSVVALGVSTLDIDENYCWLIDTETGQPIPVTIVDGYFANAHDIAVTSVTAYPTSVLIGDPIYINVTVKNQGLEAIFDVTIYYNATADDFHPIESRTITLEALTDTTLTDFTWDTTDVPPGIYTIFANASVPDDIDTEDNTCYMDDTVKVGGFPVASFTYSPEDPKAGDEVTFDASASYDPDAEEPPGIVSYTWDFGDGETDTGMIVYHTYAENQCYTVTLNITDSDGWWDIESKSIMVGVPPVAEFTYSPYPVVAKDEKVTFDASASYDPDGTIESYDWDFGDGVVIHDRTTPTYYHVYKSTGTFTVTLNITDSDGLWNTTSKSITVGIGPVARFTWSPDTPVAGHMVTFDASASYDPDGTIESYDRDFGDETPDGTGETATHTYAAAGDYTVTLTVTDNDGLTNTATKILTVNPPIHDIAVTTVKPSVKAVIIGEPMSINVTVKNEGTETETFTVVAYHNLTAAEWAEIGTQEVTGLAANAETTLTFTWDTAEASPGNYTIKAEAIVDVDNDLTDNTKHYDFVTVRGPPVALFIYSPTEPIVGDTVTFDASGSTPDGGIIVSYDWDFGDETPDGTGETTTHAYAEAGTYTVTLTVTDSEGVTDTTTQSIIIGKLSSTISIAASPSSVTVGETTTISGSVTPTRVGVTVTIWYRLSGAETWSTLETVTTDENSQYSYDWTPTAAGTYEVKASWLGDENTSPAESDVQPITVQEPPSGIPWYLYIAAAGVAAIIMAATFYFLRIRKPKPA